MFQVRAKFLAAVGAAALCLSGCVEEAAETGATASGSGGEDGTRILIDGSSTVYPISAAMAEAFAGVDPSVKVNVAAPSGTGGGFKKFVVGETDINDASRPIKDSEIAKCKENGIEFVELKVAIDGLSVVVHPDNDWCNALTVAQLKTLWEPDSKITKWSQLNPDWPDEEIKLYGPDKDSGTFDYFTEEVVGESKASRNDYEPSSNDNILVTGVSGNKYTLGYFGYAYYVKNKDKVKAVAISPTDNPADGVTPTPATIEAGQYTPLSRPLFIYVNTARLGDPKVVEFLEYYVGGGQDYVGKANYIKLSDAVLKETQASLQRAISSAE